ncbi:MAG: hypothetical protein QM579_11880 [Desulfovibrio sp.]|uniref:hypothetical protein n=1 Tax=Desulfovibrio sp. TaxID=885 RepID=UPI0039E2F907
MEKANVKLEVSSPDAKVVGYKLIGGAQELCSSFHCVSKNNSKISLNHHIYTLICFTVLVCVLVFSQEGFSKDASQGELASVGTIPTKATGEVVSSLTSEEVSALPPEPHDRPVEVRELWTGSLYSSTYKVGVCFSADGNVRGVVQLRLYNGQVDVYHIVGSVQNNEIQARHSSGHTFKGRLVSGDKVEGTIKLKNGMKVQLEGKRTYDVPLAPENCAPLPE